MRPRNFLALLALLAFPAYAQEAPRLLSYSSGTGFVVERGGVVLTNFHVVNGCRDLTVFGAVPEGDARVTAVDMAHDLALVQTAALPLGVAKFSTEKQPLAARDRVLVVGYPGQSWQTGELHTREATILRTDALSDGVQWLTFSDALSGGNSGGPLLDNAGNVVGVVTAKGRVTHPPKDGVAQDEETFDMAVSLPVLRQFLSEHGVRTQSGDNGIYLSAGQITEQARLFVVNLRCRLNEEP
ncbi:MAG: serine protease [Rickettsiales bacterium]|nr:serine protease [Rickettsiales bacterium]